MQAQWARTPFRLAVPVTGLLCPSYCPVAGSLFSSTLPLSHRSQARSGSRPCLLSPTDRLHIRPSSSASSRWKQRQGADHFAREARVQGLKSRAAFKLLELDAKYHLFRRGKGQVVVDLGFAPGSWSQVALDRTSPDGRVVGIDIIPAQPPRGVSTIQGNFLSPGVQAMVKQFLLDGEKRRKAERVEAGGKATGQEKDSEAGIGDGDGDAGMDEVADRPSYIDLERMAAHESEVESPSSPSSSSPSTTLEDAAAPEDKKTKPNLRLVDVVLSDMMMNTSGVAFRDHAGSMDLCKAALSFASDTLKNGGHFVCKFYQGAEDKAFETMLKRMFARVHREKPESSRSESKEAFFVALRRKGGVSLEDVDVQQ
ncbi:2' O-ribose methyltransferase [Madurella fahalii]|uniref:rRNA methyltransferase 2, mitochondrial n=1 Tax=Madurella fahalii TaxID=1157608 RepID=A0ABQ0GES7_9PEZI